ncbi:GNAT family N-acetyltransferase [Nocardia sp. NPDC005825]|uniref:GNAT family N-acetyltransferase n=1 Tax=unclassified Nocardia TaxID=2637762 RepID=UPI0033DBA05D
MLDVNETGMSVCSPLEVNYCLVWREFSRTAHLDLEVAAFCGILGIIMHAADLPSVQLNLTITDEVTAARAAAVKAGLAAHNLRVDGADAAVPIGVFAECDGVLVAGVTGFTQWGWLFVEYLWVADDSRGQGLGTYLLRKVESAARVRGCAAVWLDTFSFQAPDFYQRRGYRTFGQLADYPMGHSRHFLWMPLSRSSM